VFRGKILNDGVYVSKDQIYTPRLRIHTLKVDPCDRHTVHPNPTNALWSETIAENPGQDDASCGRP
jgi:hypothetical protein